MGLSERLVGAKIIRRDTTRDLTLVWCGGHGVYAFDSEGRVVAFWVAGNLSQDAATEAEVMALMEDKVRSDSNSWGG